MSRDGKMAHSTMSLLAGAVTLTAFMTTTAVTGSGAQAKKDPKRNGLPAAVLEALDANKPGAQIDKVTIEDEAGVKFYDMEF